MFIQFYSPHPDDIEVFCGGTLLKHFYDHEDIQVLIMTRGGQGTIVPSLKGRIMEEIRTREVKNRYKRLKGVSIVWMEFKDSNVRISDHAINLVGQYINRPDLIYMPESNEERSIYKHQDHIHTGKIVEASAQIFTIHTTLRYYHSKEVNSFVNIEPYFMESQRALKYYRSQSKFIASPPLLLLGAPIFRRFWTKLMGRKSGCHFAEGFREVGVPL